MKVLGIVCSPRIGGNTEILVREVLNSAQRNGAEVELVTLAGKEIRFCEACATCRKTLVCRINDDMQAIYLKLKEADGIVFGSPVYFRTVSGQAKVFIDRLLPFAAGKTLRDKVASAVVVAQRAGNTSAFAVFDHLFNGLRMMNAGGVMAYGYEKGDVKEDERGMAEARAVGRVMVRYILRNQNIDRSMEVEKPLTLPAKIKGNPM